MVEKRLAFVDYLKFLSMLGIVMIHVINQGGILSDLSLNSVELFTIKTIFTLVLCSVNIFAIITGILYCDKKNIKIKKIIELIVYILFYSFLITSVFYLFNFFDVRNKGFMLLFSSILPCIVGRYWYITQYVLLFFIIPYLNSFLERLNRAEMKRFLILLFIFFCLFSGFGIDLYKVQDGYSAYWLIYCYMIGFYIRKFEPRIDLKKSIFILFLMIFIASTSNFLLNYFWNNQSLKWILITYNSPFIIISSILIVIIFYSTDFKNSSIINFFQKHSFQVYLIHGHILIFEYVLSNIYKVINYNNIILLLIEIIIISFIIYVLCSLIDSIRSWLFKITRVDYAINKLDNFYNNLNERNKNGKNNR